MGAAQSLDQRRGVANTPSLPLDLLRSPHPLHTLIHATSALPNTPDAALYTTLFHDYVILDAAISRPLAALIAATLAQPSGPHARSLVAALRAAVHHLRSSDPQAILGALQLSFSALAELRRAAPSDNAVCLVLGAGDAEAQLDAPDRIDLGRSLVARLITAALNAIHSTPSSSFAGHISLAAIQLTLVALADELYRSPGPIEPISQIVDRYPFPHLVVTALLDLVADAASYAHPAALLEVSSQQGPSSGRLGGAGTSRGGGPSSVFGSGVLSLPTGVQDALSAISARIPLSPFASTPRTGNRSSLTQQDIEIPDAIPDSFSLHIPETVRDPSPSPTASVSAETDSAQFIASEEYVVIPDANHQPSSVDSHTPIPSWIKGLKSSLSERNSRGLNTNEDMIRIVPEKPRLVAEEALSLLGILCGPRPGSPFRVALFQLEDKSKKGVDEQSCYSFGKLYETLGKWIAHPRGALVAYHVITGNKRFRTFALASTEPDVLVVPLLASLRTRCAVGNIPADAYMPATIMLILTSDKGFCEAMDAITAPPSWLVYIEDKSRLGSEDIAMSGLVLLVCTRVVQQSLVMRRRRPDCFLSSVCLGIMGNVSGDVTNLHALAAERLLSLVEFLGRRRKKAIICASQMNGMNVKSSKAVGSAQENRREEERLATGESVGSIGDGMSEEFCLEKSEDFVEHISEFVGVSLEIMVCVLRSRSVVSANRHLVYTLLHREAILDSIHVTEASAQSQALSHMLRRMLDFFGKFVDECGDSAGEDGGGRKSGHGYNGGTSGISVDRVFQVIDKNARHFRQDVFDGVGNMRFRYEESQMSEAFVRPYSWSLVMRWSRFFWDSDQTFLAIGQHAYVRSE